MGFVSFCSAEELHSLGGRTNDLFLSSPPPPPSLLSCFLLSLLPGGTGMIEIALIETQAVFRPVSCIMLEKSAGIDSGQIIEIYRNWV